MRRTPFLGAVTALCLVVGGAACGDDDGGGDSEADITNQLSETLQAGGDGFDKEAADCFAEIIVDETGLEKLQDVDLTADEPPEELQDEIAAAAVRASEECDLSGLSG